MRSEPFYFRFDVRAKILFTITFTFSVFIAHSLWLLSALALMAFALILIELGLGRTLKALSLITPVLMFMVLFLPLQKRDGEAIAVVHGFSLATKEGLMSFAFTAERFISISLLYSLLMNTTSTTSFILALQSFNIPYSFSLVLAMALRFIPTISETFQRIRESQSLRLPNPNEEERRKGKLRDLLPTLTSILVVSLKSIPSTAAALDMRGYRPRGKRSSAKELPRIKEVASHFLIPLIFLAFLVICEVMQ